MNTVELAAEYSLRVKARHIDSILVREASTSGRLTHKRHAMPFWIDPPFQVFNDGLPPFTKDGLVIEVWLATHKPMVLSRLVRGRRKEVIQAFPILSPVAKPAQEREGAEGRQAAYLDRLQGARGVPGGPRRTWLDKLVG